VQEAFVLHLLTAVEKGDLPCREVLFDSRAARVVAPPTATASNEGHKRP